MVFIGIPTLLSKSNHPAEITLDGTTLSVTSKFKLLDSTLDPSLNFARQVIQTSNFHLCDQTITQIPTLQRRRCYFDSLLCGISNYLSCNLFKIVVPKLFFKPITILHLVLASITFIGCRLHQEPSSSCR